MNDKHESRLRRLPVVGTIERGLRERGPFGLLLFVGVTNLGAGLGALVAHGDPLWQFYVGFWIVTGIVACGYAIFRGEASA